MDWWVVIIVAALAVAGVVEGVKALLWAAQWPSDRARDVLLRLLAVALGAVGGVIAGDVLAGLAGGGLSTTVYAAVSAAIGRWGRTAPVPWASTGAEPDSETGHGHGEPVDGGAP